LPVIKYATNNSVDIPRDNTGSYYFLNGNSASITAGNATKLSITTPETVCNKSGDGDIICDFDMNDFYPLDNTTFTTAYSNAVATKTLTFNRKAKPVTVTANTDQTSSTGEDAILS